VAIRYFTARVRPLPNDPHAPQRQQVYLRALQTIPHLSIHYGMFLKNKKRMALVNPPPNTAEVWSTEEKGSDVNLASHLLLDGFQGKYDLAGPLPMRQAHSPSRRRGDPQNRKGRPKAASHPYRLSG
jgi:hypothetical protein